jgi:hypothetical protein
LTGRFDAARKSPERISGHPNRWTEKKQKPEEEEEEGKK